MQLIFPKSISKTTQWRPEECNTHFIHRDARGKENVSSEIPPYLQRDPTVSEHRAHGFSSRHRTFKHSVSLMKNTWVLENHFESSKYRGMCLFRRRGIAISDEDKKSRRKRESATDWYWSSQYSQHLTPAHQRTEKGQKLLMWSVATWKTPTVLNRKIQRAANPGAGRSATVFSNKVF